MMNKKNVILIILGITIFLSGCILRRPHTVCDSNYCNHNHVTPYITPLCRVGDRYNSVKAPAVVQASSPEATLTVKLHEAHSSGKTSAIPLTDLELDILEGSIMHYREVHGYARRYRDRRTYQQLMSERYR